MSKHMGTPRRTARFGPLVAILAAFGLVLGMLGLAAPAQATGNNGTIKIHEEGTPVGTEDNDPKVCSFNIESYNLDAGQDGYIVFDVQGGDGPVGTPAGPFDFGPADETGFFATEYYSLDNGHYKATLYGKFGDGGINYEDVKAKSKVFKVECPPVTVEPEGGNTSFSSDCESITVGQPTGVKPEGATVVVKLDGVVTQPGTYAVEPGEYVVTTYVNDKLVDTDTVTVAKCEDEVEPEGNLNVSSTCESITFSSTGVKPEDAEQVFKLDGVVKAAGTYAVAAGSHTVELFVNGEKVDSKTIVVEVCEDEVVNEGSNNSSSPACKQITVGQPTGIKPEGATVVVKLDGVVTQPGTYATTPGTHVVTTFVNGTLVDTDTVVVADCPVTPPPVVVPPVVTPPVVVPPVVTPPVVKRDNPSASVKASCVTARWGEGVAKLNNKRSDVRNKFRIVRNGPDKVVTLKAGKKRSVMLTGLRVGSVVKVKSGGELLAKTRVPRGCEPTPVPNTGFRKAASMLKSSFGSLGRRLFGA